jgi:hypothetical protein
MSTNGLPGNRHIGEAPPTRVLSLALRTLIVAHGRSLGAPGRFAWCGSCVLRAASARRRRPDAGVGHPLLSSGTRVDFVTSSSDRACSEGHVTVAADAGLAGVGRKGCSVSGGSDRSRHGPRKRSRTLIRHGAHPPHGARLERATARRASRPTSTLKLSGKALGATADSPYGWSKCVIELRLNAIAADSNTASTLMPSNSTQRTGRS